MERIGGSESEVNRNTDRQMQFAGMPDPQARILEIPPPFMRHRHDEQILVMAVRKKVLCDRCSANSNNGRQRDRTKPERRNLHDPPDSPLPAASATVLVSAAVRSPAIRIGLVS